MSVLPASVAAGRVFGSGGELRRTANTHSHVGYSQSREHAFDHCCGDRADDGLVGPTSLRGWDANGTSPKVAIPTPLAPRTVRERGQVADENGFAALGVDVTLSLVGLVVGGRPQGDVSHVSPVHTPTTDGLLNMPDVADHSSPRE